MFENEAPGDSPLLERDEVIFTPHLGAYTTEAQESVAIAVAEQFVDFFNKGIIRNALNMPSIDPEHLSLVKPYLTLGELLGLFIL